MTCQPTLPFTPEMHATLREWGPRWHEDIVAGRDAMYAAWAPLLAAAPPVAGRVEQDVAYGADPRQVLDINVPDDVKDAPVLVFVHGGAFVRGDKQATPHMYGNVLAEFARHGFVAVNVEYRLATQQPWPSGAEDVRDAVLWVSQHIASRGGDPRRIFLAGHSAGCAHCATAVWDDVVRPPQGLPLVGLALLSPRVAADVRPENPNAHGVRAYYGRDETLYARRGPISHVRPDAPPTFIAVAHYENPLLEFQAFELAHRLALLADAQGGPMPRLVQYTDHNHVSVVAQFNTPHNKLGADLRDWFSRVLHGEFAARRKTF